MTIISREWNIESELKREEERENEHIFYEEVVRKAGGNNPAFSFEDSLK